MKLASYKSTRPGVQGVFNRLVRWRLEGPHSHTEVVFEPCDYVDGLMPDGSCQPDAEGGLWCASAVAWERLPAWSQARPGKRGGVRFKRIALDPAKWDLVDANREPYHAARWFKAHEGEPYSWRLIARFIAWVVTQGALVGEWTCSQAAAAAMLFPDAWRFDPCTLHIVISEEQRHGR